MNRREFLLLTGSATAFGATTAVARQSPSSSSYPRIQGDILDEFKWTQTNQYTRTSEEDNGTDQGITDSDIGGEDKWYITEFTDRTLGGSIEKSTQEQIKAPISHLWSLRVDPSRLTKMGWWTSGKFGEMGELGTGIDSAVIEEFESRIPQQFSGEVEFYPPSPINMRAVRAAGEAIVSKLPGGSFVDEAKTWIKGPCSGLVTSSGEGVFYEKYWVRQRITENELMEYKGVYADWITDSEFRAVAGVVPWSFHHIEETAENLGYELSTDEPEIELEDELKHLMANVEF